MTSARQSTDVLVIGGGPAGAATGYWLARHGHDVVVVERRRFPRDKTCGDAISPGAVRELTEMGLGDAVASFHPTRGLRLAAFGRSIDVPWPAHPDRPDRGAVARRRDLDTLVLRNAEATGARVLEEHEALLPIVERGFVRGATVQRSDGSTLDIAARYLVLADGATSRFGRTLGTFRERSWPYATAIRSYWPSPRHDDPWLESTLELTDRHGDPLPGYGWVFPVGDGTVNLGVGVLSTSRDFKSVNTSHLLDEFARSAAERWDLDPDAPETKPVSGRLPLGLSVGPKAGPTYLVVGDAGGSANPFNGDGIAAAFETARLAAGVLDDALSGRDPTALQRYPALLDEHFGDYFTMGRLFARIASRPAVLRGLTRAGLHSPPLMRASVRLMTNSLRPDHIGAAEAAYGVGRRLLRLAPTA